MQLQVRLKLGKRELMQSMLLWATLYFRWQRVCGPDARAMRSEGRIAKFLVSRYADRLLPCALASAIGGTTPVRSIAGA